MENLDAIYRQMNRMTDSRRIQSDLEKLKNGEDRRYREEVARCKLEKAYVLLMDLHAETCKTPSVYLNEAQRALTHEIEHSQGPRQQSQKEAMQHIRVAKAAVAEAQKRLGALQTNCTLETKSGRDIAEKLFEKGIEEMEGLISRNNSLECEVLIWKHYFGKTCNRIGSTSRQELTTTEKKKYLRKAIDLFNEVITKLIVPENDGVCGMKKNEKMGIIVCLVRSYAYLGHILLLKDRIIAGNGQSPPVSISDTFWKDPWSSFVKGLSLSKTHGCHDRVILNRLALTLVNVKKTADNEENNKEELENIDDNSREELENLLAEMKRKNPWVKTTCPKKSPLQRDDTDFKNAEFLCRLSLHLWDYPNWFGHSVLMKVYMGWYRFQLDEYNESKKGKDRPTHELDKNLLRLAKLSGQNVLQSRITTDTLLDIAQVLYDSALKPGIGKDFRKTRVEDGKEILVCEALGYLQTAQDYHDCENHSRKHALLGQCLFDIGEKKKAIQYMKIAVGMERSNRDPINFETACRLIADGCETEKDKSSKKSKLKELWFMIDGNMRRYGKRLSYQLKGVANSYPHTVLEMLNLVKDEPEKFCSRTKQIFDTCLQTLLKHNGQRVKSRAEKLQKSLPEDMEKIVFSLYDRSQERPGELQDSYPSDEPRTHGKKYDCYVHYSMADKDWVESFFLPCLKPEGPAQCKCELSVVLYYKHCILSKSDWPLQ